MERVGAIWKLAGRTVKTSVRVGWEVAVSMASAEEPVARVNTKALVVDPETMEVIWMNEAAALDAGASAGDQAAGSPLAETVPLAEMMGVLDAARGVADSGKPSHLQADLVSTAKGGVKIVSSIYRLPDGKLLVLTENAWQPRHDKAEGGGSRASRRRGR